MSISIGTDAYSSVASALQQAKQSSSTSKLESQLNATDYKTATDEELMDACKSFEQYFLEQVVKQVKKTIPNQEEESKYKEYFGELLYQDYAKKITDSGELGIAKQLFEAMKRNT